MKNMEIICGGIVEASFEAVGITPTKTYEASTHLDARTTIWLLTQEEMDTLITDGLSENIQWDNENAWWCHVDSINVKPQMAVMINSHSLIGFPMIFSEEEMESWTPEQREFVSRNEWTELLDHIIETLSLTSVDGLVGGAVEIARANNLTLGELFTRCQPSLTATV